MPVDLECVTGDDRQVFPRAKRGGESAILLDGDHLQTTSEQDISQGAPPWPNFNNGLSRVGIERVHDPRQNRRITEKMLAEPSQTLSRTSVRSSLAGAPSVNAAISVNTDIAAFTDGAPANDDRTLILLKV